jgi:hypothetical protein
MDKVLIIAILMLSSCAIQRANISNEAKTEMIGMSKSDLLMCAGVPSREYKDNGVEFLSYDSGGDSIGGAIANNTTNTAIFAKKRKYCIATFAIEDNKIVKINYQGRTGGLLTAGEQCAFVVEGCIKK